MKKLFVAVIPLYIVACMPNHVLKTYTGKAWTRQTIPGKIECELYDTGGEAVAYHDADSLNNGSGKLNPANGNFLNEFRRKEGVDISYTKSGNIDNNAFNIVPPQMNQLYIGWTRPGEWICYSVRVKRTGLYKVSAHYTANGDGSVSFDIDGKPAAENLKIPSTHNEADTVAWRQWHHWNTARGLTQLHLYRGIHVLTLHVAEHGDMNFDYLEFK